MAASNLECPRAVGPVPRPSRADTATRPQAFACLGHIWYNRVLFRGKLRQWCSRTYWGRMPRSTVCDGTDVYAWSK